MYKQDFGWVIRFQTVITRPPMMQKLLGKNIQRHSRYFHKNVQKMTNVQQKHKPTLADMLSTFNRKNNIF